LIQSLRFNFSVEHTIAIGWTVAADISVAVIDDRAKPSCRARRRNSIPVPSNQRRYRLRQAPELDSCPLQPAPLFNSLITDHLSVGFKGSVSKTESLVRRVIEWKGKS
jgi:hypothetical protein